MISVNPMWGIRYDKEIAELREAVMVQLAFNKHNREESLGSK